jgi:hypothetical protein
MGMAEKAWMVTGARSDEVIVTAPGAVTVDEAVRRLDDALAGFAGPVPGWYGVISRLGHWWYLVCALVAVPVTIVLVGGVTVRAVLYGLVATYGLALVSGLVMSRAAMSQSRRPDGRGRDQTVAEVAHVARPMVMQDAVRAVLEQAPAREPEVHELAWRVAGGHDADGMAALRELIALWGVVDPQAAAAQAALWDDADEADESTVARDH